VFQDLDESLQRAIAEAGFTEPTAVQIETLDKALTGDDLFVSAETGSGKTAAYLLPIFERLLANERGQVRALVLVPTRELAQQVLKQAKQLARFTEITLGHIGGATDLKKQAELLKNPSQFLVATPGRLLDLLARDLIDLDAVETLILDEADRLLDMGFSEEILGIAQHCAQRSQTSLFSATLANKNLRGLADKLLDNPHYIELNRTSDTHDSIDRQVMFVDDKAHKMKCLMWLVKNEAYKRCIIFCNSKEQVDQIFRLMQQQGINAGVLHGDKDQKHRNLIMSKLRRDELNVLVASDLAARGIDIEGMDLVINFQLPRRGEIYVHRVGRTGRAGNKGVALSLVEPTEFNLMASIERYLRTRFKRRVEKEISGSYSGPKKLKSSGKAYGTKKKKVKKDAAKKASRKSAKKK
jgi:ATP-dependent RNA helicase SrmB